MYARLLQLDTKFIFDNCNPSALEFNAFLLDFVEIYYSHDKPKLTTINTFTINIPLKLIHSTTTPANQLREFKRIVCKQYFCEQYLNDDKPLSHLKSDFIINTRFLRQFNKKFYKSNVVVNIIWYIFQILFFIIIKIPAWIYASFTNL